MGSSSHNQRVRPASVTWLALSVFVLSTVNLFGAVDSILRWSFLSSLDLTLPPWVLAALRGSWGLGWLIAAWGLWRLSPRARRAVIYLLPVYMIMLVGEQIIFARGGYERGRLPFVIVFAVLLAGAAVVLLTRPSSKKAFEHIRDDGEHKESESR